ncbi:MAG: hypothetical protein DWQ37_06045 [Planctomycetota bacterium]|nr:MAG: hypothetical protein DWQ37_06045 [Planctomycetota bacterium]
MSGAASSSLVDRARIQELESQLDLSQEELEKKVRHLIAETEQVTAKIREELAALYEAKAKELRQRASDLRTNDATSGKSDSLAEKTAREAAIEILRASGRPMHYADVARVAVSRGYGGGDLDPEDRVVKTTFRRTLGKWPDLFVRTDAGTYRHA